MTEMSYGTGTAEVAATPASDVGDSPGYDETSLDTGYAGDIDALAAEDQLPARQESRAATWGDSPDYDEVGLGAEYDGDLGALTAEDQLPARQDSRNATWGDTPEYDEVGPGAGYAGDIDALAAEDQLPARQESRAATWGDSPDYDEADLGAGYDGDLGALTAEDQTPDTGDDHALDRAAGDQDQAAAEEASPATGKPGNRPAEDSGDSAAAAPEQGDGNVTAPESSPAGASADSGNVTEANVGERPREAPQAGQADALAGQGAQVDEGHAHPGAAMEVGLKELKAEYEASLKELKAEYKASLKDLEAEVQALKDRRQAAPDVPRNTGREADQPRAVELPADRKNAEEAEHKDDRPGLWSNAKSVLYGGAGSMLMLAAADQFAPGIPHPIVDIVTGAVTAAGLFVPVAREGWKRKHDDSPNNP